MQQKKLAMSVAVGLMCLGLFACGKEEKPTASTTVVVPAAPAAPAAPTTVVVPGAPAAPAAAPTTVVVPGASAPTTNVTVVKPESDEPLSHFTANGNSPAWNATINGNTVTFEVPETMKPDGGKRTITVERAAYAKGANYNGKDGNVNFSLDINGKACTLTGNKREFTATLAYGKSVYKGCADGIR